MNRLKTILVAALVVGASPAALATGTNFEEKAELYAVHERSAIRAGLIEGRNISPRVDREYWFDRSGMHTMRPYARAPFPSDPYDQPVRRSYGWVR